MEKVYIVIKVMFLEDVSIHAVYRNKNDAHAAVLEIVKKHNESGGYVPLEAEVMENRIVWGDGDDFYIEIVEMDLL